MTNNSDRWPIVEQGLWSVIQLDQLTRGMVVRGNWNKVYAAIDIFFEGQNTAKFKYAWISTLLQAIFLATTRIAIFCCCYCLVRLTPKITINYHTVHAEDSPFYSSQLKSRGHRADSQLEGKQDRYRPHSPYIFPTWKVLNLLTTFLFPFVFMLEVVIGYQWLLFRAEELCGTTRGIQCTIIKTRQFPESCR